MFPSAGRLAVDPRRDDVVRVVGNLGTYRGRPQIRPLSARHVEVRAGDAVALAQARSAPEGRTMRVGPVVAARVLPFAGRGGRRHLEVEFVAPGGGARTRGVVFAGDWTDETLRLLSSGLPVELVAQRDDYGGEPSLIARLVEPANRP